MNFCHFYVMSTHTFSAWQRVLCLPLTARWWHSDGSLMLGYPHNGSVPPIRISRHSREIYAWLNLCDGTMSMQELRETAAAMAIPAEFLNELLSLLVHRCILREHEVLPPSGLEPVTQRNVEFLRNVLVGSPQDIVLRRQSARVTVDGSGNLATAVITALAAQAIKCAWVAESPHRIRPDDVVGSAVLTEHDIAQSWQRTPLYDPGCDLVVLIRDVYDPEYISATYPSTPVLLVTAHAMHCTVGPLMNTTLSICFTCLHEHYASTTSDWNYATVQLTHDVMPPITLGSPWLELVSHLASAAVVHLIDSESLSFNPAQVVHFAPPHPTPVVSIVPRRAECDCIAGEDLQPFSTGEMKSETAHLRHGRAS